MIIYMLSLQTLPIFVPYFFYLLTFSKFYRRYYDLISKFRIGLKSLLCYGLKFYGDLVYRLKKIVDFNNFSAPFIKIFSQFKKIGYNFNILQQTAAWWSTQSQLTILLSSLIARRWVRLQILWRFQLKDLSIDEIIGA